MGAPEAEPGGLVLTGMLETLQNPVNVSALGHVPGAYPASRVEAGGCETGRAAESKPRLSGTVYAMRFFAIS